MIGTVVKKGCRICGIVDGVQSHLIPNAVIQDAKGGEPNLVMGTRFADGQMKTQSGIWDDDILCTKHEGILGDIDKAGIEFCRSFLNATIIIKPGLFTMGPPGSDLSMRFDVDLLVKFVAAVLWRCSVSDKFGVHMFKLGAAAERKIADILFHGAPVSTFPGVSFHGVASAIPALHGVIHFPKMFPVRGVKLARFQAYSMIFTAEVGRKSFKALDPLRINGKNQITTGFLPYEETLEHQGTGPIVQKMGLKRSGWHPQSRRS